MSSQAWRDANKERRAVYRKKQYQREKQKDIARVRERRKELRLWLKGVKELLVCNTCGEDETCCLEFHHDNPEDKEMSISRSISMGWSKQRILKEIEKCTILCCNCHRKLHASL